MYMTDAWPEPSGIQNSACFGAFHRFREINRKRNLLKPEEIISRMTKQAADRFGIKDRGIIKDGAMGDLVILNWDSITDNCTPKNSDAAPTGIDHVFINGFQVVENGKNIEQSAHGQILEVV